MSKNFDDKTRRQESDATLALSELNGRIEDITNLEELEEVLTIVLTKVRQKMQDRKSHLGEPLTGPSLETLY